MPCASLSRTASHRGPGKYEPFLQPRSGLKLSDVSKEGHSSWSSSREAEPFLANTGLASGSSMSPTSEAQSASLSKLLCSTTGLGTGSGAFVGAAAGSMVVLFCASGASWLSVGRSSSRPASLCAVSVTPALVSVPELTASLAASHSSAVVPAGAGWSAVSSSTAAAVYAASVVGSGPSTCAVVLRVTSDANAGPVGGFHLGIACSVEVGDFEFLFRS